MALPLFNMFLYLQSFQCPNPLCQPTLVVGKNQTTLLTFRGLTVRKQYWPIKSMYNNMHHSNNSQTKRYKNSYSLYSRLN